MNGLSITLYLSKKKYLKQKLFLLSIFLCWYTSFVSVCFSYGIHLQNPTYKSSINHDSNPENQSNSSIIYFNEFNASDWEKMTNDRFLSFNNRIKNGNFSTYENGPIDFSSIDWDFSTNCTDLLITGIRDGSLFVLNTDEFKVYSSFNQDLNVDWELKDKMIFSGLLRINTNGFSDHTARSSIKLSFSDENSNEIGAILFYQDYYGSSFRPNSSILTNIKAPSNFDVWFNISGALNDYYPDKIISDWSLIRSLHIELGFFTHVNPSFNAEFQNLSLNIIPSLKTDLSFINDIKEKDVILSKLTGMSTYRLNLTEKTLDVQCTNNTCLNVSWMFENNDCSFIGLGLIFSNQSDLYIVSNFSSNCLNNSEYIIISKNTEASSVWYEHSSNVSKIYMRAYGYCPSFIEAVDLFNIKDRPYHTNQTTYFSDIVLENIVKSNSHINPTNETTDTKSIIKFQQDIREVSIMLLFMGISILAVIFTFETYLKRNNNNKKVSRSKMIREVSTRENFYTNTNLSTPISEIHTHKPKSDFSWFIVFICWIIELIYAIYRPKDRNISSFDLYDNPTRQKILYILEINQFEHFRELQRLTKAGIGLVAWHLEVLMDFGVIKSKRYGQFRVYFLADNPPCERKLDLYFALRSSTAQKIINVFIENKHISFSSNGLSRVLQTNEKLIKYHLTKLNDLKLVTSSQETYKLAQTSISEIQEILSHLKFSLT